MRDILTSPRVEDMKRKRRKRWIRLLILISILIIVLVGALAYFSNYRRLTIHTVSVTGTRIINASDVQDAVRGDISGKYVYLFAKANTVIYPHNRIVVELVRDFPRIESITVSRVGWNTLHVAIVERSGSFLYCGAQLPTEERDRGENCYFINNDGYIFDKAPYFSGNIYFKYYLTLGKNISTPLGTQMLPQDRFHEMTRFIDKVTVLGFKPIYLTIGTDGIDSLYLDHTSSATATKIIFKNDNDLATIIDNLATSMRKHEFAGEINSKYSKLLYIDLRFKNKVLYKFNE